MTTKISLEDLMLERLIKLPFEKEISDLQQKALKSIENVLSESGGFITINEITKIAIIKWQLLNDFKNLLNEESSVKF